MSKRNGTPCTKRFSDPSSLARHLKEQHKGSTYQCPIPGCVDRANKPKCIKRSSEFKKHLSKKHGVVMEDVDQFSVTTWSDETSLVPVSPKPRKRKSAKRDAAPVPTEPTLVFVEEPLPMATPSPAPPYSAVPYAGEVPLLCVPSDDGYASTPGMTYASPSPAPSMPEIVYDMGSEESACPPSYTTLDGYGNVVQDPFPQKDMSTYQVDNALGIGLMLSDSDLNNDSYARGLNYLSYNDMLPLTDMNMAASYGQMSMPCENFAQKTYMDPALSMYSSQCAFDFAPALESSGQADYFAGYSAWDLAVPEQSYAPQTNAIIPPSLPTFMTSNLGMFTTE
ncbi:hypothetical protein PYCCODRAFT_118070 [Trametes coccinea BRFM310]|uniref:C2H2-type domain-containing protein n=1 Tax=Trametes coccinea (strain BRFM310) TaxID=1353009 RepID=A0A1Y2IWN7_TRAC3|nr:hypothetical protein PYCCODRAFT_118070 [Trametes coccinea BRFM310]